MDGLEEAEKPRPHAVCVPFPAQGHITPMLKLAKILHYRGFHITFVNSEFNHRRLLKSQGPDALRGLPSFRFETIPDGLPASHADATQDVPSLCDSTRKACLAPFAHLVSRLNHTSTSKVPPITCMVSDGIMTFTLTLSKQLGIPNVLFWTNGAAGVMGYLQYRQLQARGFTPLKDASYLTNGYLDTVIDWIPGMEGIRLKELPTFVRTTDPNDIMLNFAMTQVERVHDASALILNTFDALERPIIDALSSILPAPVYTIGPLQLKLNQIQEEAADDDEEEEEGILKSVGSNLWKEETGCLSWLDSKDPNSVLYVNFGSVTVMTAEQMTEFAWGLANSKQIFLWVIRPDLVIGDSAMLPPHYKAETKDRGLLTSWCPQEQVLCHPSVGGFLSHCGWNSTLESVCGGVPMICWPFFAEQQTNCWYCCTRLGMGMESNSDAKRDEISQLVRELMIGDRGREMKKKAMEWKKLAEEAIASPHASSCLNLDKLIQLLLHNSK